jgi:hypothetical protein
MKKLIPNGGNDKVYTPDSLAISIVAHFKSQISKYHTILEPCYGQGAFLRAFAKCGFIEVFGLELDKGQDFFEYDQKVDWIITNPPWSKVRDFFIHAYAISDNIIFLITVNHLIGLRRRLSDMNKAGFGIKEILFVDTPPPPWPQSGFQLGALHLQRGWKNKTKLNWRLVK